MANECFLSNDPNCGCGSSLDIKKLCVRCAEVCWQKSKQIWAEDINVNNVCAQKVLAKEGQAQSLTVDNLCAMTANINDLCVTNLKASNYKPCNTSRAAVRFANDFMYTLGNDINFDVLLDNPSNIATIGPTKFTVPVAGYWEFNISVNAFNLAGSGVITGAPIARLSVYVNGVSRQAITVPFLTFATDVKASLMADLILAANDVVTAQLDVLVLDSVGGQIEYVGTMSIKGGDLAATADPSVMSIILKSELCGVSSPITCTTCVPAQVPCEPVVGPRCEDCPTQG